MVVIEKKGLSSVTVAKIMGLCTDKRSQFLLKLRTPGGNENDSFKLGSVVELKMRSAFANETDNSGNKTVRIVYNVTIRVDDKYWVRVLGSEQDEEKPDYTQSGKVPIEILFEIITILHED